MTENFRHLLVLTGVLIAALALIGAGCPPTPATPGPAADAPTDSAFDYDFDQICPPGSNFTNQTPSGATICNGVDSKLIGFWQLQSQTVVGQNLRLAGSSPNAEGRTDTFYPNRAFTEDYGMEKYEKQTVNTPDGPAASQCQSSGMSGGNYYATFIQEGDIIKTYLEVDRDTRGGLQVTCDGPGGQNVTSTATSVPLASSPPAATCEGSFAGPCVRYRYEISADGNTLTITTTAGADATYVFTRR